MPSSVKEPEESVTTYQTTYADSSYTVYSGY